MMGTVQSNNNVSLFLLYFTDGVYFCVSLLFKIYDGSYKKQGSNKIY